MLSGDAGETASRLPVGLGNIYGDAPTVGLELESIVLESVTIYCPV
jgi:hypothetical protein